MALGEHVLGLAWLTRCVEPLGLSLQRHAEIALEIDGRRRLDCQFLEIADRRQEKRLGLGQPLLFEIQVPQVMLGNRAIVIVLLRGRLAGNEALSHGQCAPKRFLSIGPVQVLTHTTQVDLDSGLEPQHLGRLGSRVVGLYQGQGLAVDSLGLIGSFGVGQ